MSDIYPSTKGLSVYNVLSLACRDLRPAEIDAFLRRAFDHNLPVEYVDEGVAFLKSRGIASETDGLVTIQRLPDGHGPRVVRSTDDRDLVLAVDV